HAALSLQARELHRREFLVASLAHPVDERRRAHAALLPPKVLVELEEVFVERWDEPFALACPFRERFRDVLELMDRVAGDLREPVSRLRGLGLGLFDPRFEVLAQL